MLVRIHLYHIELRCKSYRQGICASNHTHRTKVDINEFVTTVNLEVRGILYQDTDTANHKHNWLTDLYILINWD